MLQAVSKFVICFFLGQSMEDELDVFGKLEPVHVFGSPPRTKLIPLFVSPHIAGVTFVRNGI